jgi:CspA family cold shock protein
MMILAEGTVRFFDSQRNFGFIVVDDGSEVFVHGSAVTGGTGRTPKEGQRATFDVEDGPKGKRATNVVLSDEFREVPQSTRPRRDDRGGGGGYRGGGGGGYRGGGGGRGPRPPKRFGKRDF